jgi:hypothetical protein
MWQIDGFLLNIYVKLFYIDPAYHFNSYLIWTKLCHNHYFKVPQVKKKKSLFRFIEKPDYNIGQIYQFFNEPKKQFFVYNSDRRKKYHVMPTHTTSIEKINFIF